MRMNCALVAALAPLLIAIPAAAETRTTYRAGAWSAFEGTANDGKRVCGAIATGGDKAMSVKYFQGSSAITVHIHKQSWAIPRGTQVNMLLQFSGETPWTVRGRGNGRLIEFNIGGDAAETFMREFRGASRGAIRFLEGTETDWTINLTGSSAATNVMAECIGRLLGERGAPSQPFGSDRAPPTQPFSPHEPGGDGGRAPRPPTGPSRKT